IRALHVALILRKNIFLTGDAETGKTRFLKFIIAYYNIIHQVNIKITASIGKAALELKSSGKTGRTIHSVFKIGKNISSNKVKWKLRDKGYCDWLRKVRAIIIDECSMVNDDLLDSIIYLFTRSGITELGKVHFIITGDFFQLPPASGGMYFLNKEWYNDKSSGLLHDLWKSLDLVYVGLTEIFRQNDPEFKHQLHQLVI
ncbi:13697_t:CDS:1, partial [Racocetra persica]